MSCYRDALVVVTGAGSGIGRQMCLQLGRQGARVVLAGRRAARLQVVQEEVARLGGSAVVAACDVTDARQVLQWTESILKTAGAVDVLVNNAGRGAYGRFELVAVDDHDAVIDTNLKGIIHTTHAMLPSMLERGEGQLVYVSSVLGQLPAPEHAVYGATKFAVNAFAESLRHELYGRGIDIVVAAPGLVDSEFAAASGRPVARFAKVPMKSAAAAAADVLRAMERRQHLAVGDRLSAAAIRLRRYAPKLFGWLFRHAFARLRDR